MDARPGHRSRGLRGLDRLHGRARGGVRAARSRRRSGSSPRFEELQRRGRRRPGARRVDRRRADLLRDRDPLRPRRGSGTARSPRSATGAGGCSRSRPSSGVALGATGTHPWSDYREQHIIDTEHYRRVEEGLKYVAWRNNTFSLHVHVGVRGADRAVLRLRPAAAGAAGAAGDLGQLAVPRRPRLRAAQRPHARSSPRAFPAAACRTRSGAGRPSPSTSSSSSAPARSSSTRRCGGRSARTSRSGRSRCGSATPRRPPRSQRRWRR